jgi:hypothetical protein
MVSRIPVNEHNSITRTGNLIIQMAILNGRKSVSKASLLSSFAAG